MIFTIAQAAKRNEAIGQHFFSRDAMRFFDCRVSRRTYPVEGGMFFVTSERPNGAPRRYTVRFICDDGRVRTMDEFRQHATPGHAHRRAATMVAQTKMPPPVHDARRAAVAVATARPVPSAEEVARGSARALENAMRIDQLLAAGSESPWMQDDFAPDNGAPVETWHAGPHSGEGALYSLERLAAVHGRAEH